MTKMDAFMDFRFDVSYVHHVLKKGDVKIMSNDLISRKAVMDYLREQQANVITEKNKNNPVTQDAMKGMLASVDAFMNFIVQLPVAYDADKVVKQLENKIAEYKLRIDSRSGACYYDETEKIRILSERLYGVEQALEIVKAGGKDD